MCWGRGNGREVGVQGNVGKSVGKCVRVWGRCVRVEDTGGWWKMWVEVKERCGGSEKMWGKVWESELGCGEEVGSLLGSVEKWDDDVGKVRKYAGVGRSVGRSEGNVGKYGEVLENVREVWGSLGKCVWGVGEVWEMCWGGEKWGEMWAEVGGVGRCWERSRECKKVWGEVRCSGREECTTPLPTPFQTYPHTFPHLFSPAPSLLSKPKKLEFSNFQCNYTLFNVWAPRKF